MKNGEVAMGSGSKLSEKEKEKVKLRERQRRAITTKIFAGLRKYGGYNLPPRADINDVLRALAAEAGWVVEGDGTTYRVPGTQPPLSGRGRGSSIDPSAARPSTSSPAFLSPPPPQPPSSALPLTDPNVSPYLSSAHPPFNAMNAAQFGPLDGQAADGNMMQLTAGHNGLAHFSAQTTLSEGMMHGTQWKEGAGMASTSGGGTEHVLNAEYAQEGEEQGEEDVVDDDNAAKDGDDIVGMASGGKAEEEVPPQLEEEEEETQEQRGQYEHDRGQAGSLEVEGGRWHEDNSAVPTVQTS